MLKTPLNIKSCVLSLTFALLFSSVCFAFNCNSISMYVDDSWAYLKKASREQRLDSAQAYMRRAKNSLDDASSAAQDCGCNQAAMEFDDAATKALRAKSASDVDDFNQQIDRCVRSLNAAIELFNDCASRRD